MSRHHEDVRVGVAGLVVAAIACAAGCTMHRPFRARSDGAWVAYEVRTEETAHTILPVFRYGAKGLGCSIDNNCTAGFKKSCYGATAYCWEETITIVALAEGRFAVGCLRPMTVEICDVLLTKIMKEWSPRADFRR